jgi:hypothetical protein
MAQTTFKGKALCDFDGKDDHEWVSKAEAHFDRRELLEYILTIDPRQDLEMVVKEEMVVVAKGKLLKSRLPRRSARR